jgi:hypothetical protein
MKLVLFVKNFSKEYITYLISKIPTKFDIIINIINYYNDFNFDINTIGFVYGSKEDETYERIRFNYIYKNEPTNMDIDELHLFLFKIN